MSKNFLSKQQTIQVVERIYSDANRLSWEGLPDRDRTEQYGKWLDDPDVGGILLSKVGRDRARVWLKDGPMKEYSRALAGKGPYAQCTGASARTSNAIVEACLGKPWAVVAGTSGIKPLHCEATDGKRRLGLIWGPAKDFKHLLWAALDRNDVDARREFKIVILDTKAQPVDVVEWERCERIGRRCGFVVLRVNA